MRCPGGHFCSVTAPAPQEQWPLSNQPNPRQRSLLEERRDPDPPELELPASQPSNWSAPLPFVLLGFQWAVAGGVCHSPF